MRTLTGRINWPRVVAVVTWVGCAAWAVWWSPAVVWAIVKCAALAYLLVVAVKQFIKGRKVPRWDPVDGCDRRGWHDAWPK